MNNRSNWELYLDGAEVTPEEVLSCREARASRNALESMIYHKTQICFGLNIAGPVKRFTIADAAFKEERRLIINQLERNDMSIIKDDDYSDSMGSYGVMLTDSNAQDVKLAMIEIEDKSRLGRIFDIDVFTSGGVPVSRSELGQMPRKCFLCGEDARICASRKLHDLKLVQEYTINLIIDYFNEQFASYIAALAAKSMIYEVAVTPKPGLVDRMNNGSHSDMNFFSFVDATGALIPYYYRLAKKGFDFDGTAEEFMCSIRFEGKEAENDMKKVTGGANTSKGLIFSMGLICAAAGFLYKPGTPPTLKDICKMCSTMCGADIIHELTYDNGAKQTRGEKQFRQYSLKGVRGEANSGYDSVRRYGLTALMTAQRKGWSINDAGVYTLLQLMGKVYDTNIIGRSNFDTNEGIRRMIVDKLEVENISSDEVIEFAKELDLKFQKMNISPGGSADLLAISYMFYFYINN
ncbi:MAG: citrate lyase holo-[acyl-carrier protein] synthase [Eubacteriaceae bacterium]|jgi:holo-ACP synthase/triphosphoribosyl-dephospho-CoA synthase|nr:citrate lyase holo-[acyl-carrier protein] synthase [Eubacteriaceae bacterium]